jgi:hypothetical protein
MWEMEGGKGAILMAHGCLCASQYSSTAECAGWQTPILHVTCAMSCATQANVRTHTELIHFAIYSSYVVLG